MGIIAGFISFLSFSSYLLNSYCVSDTRPGLGDTAVIETDIVLLSGCLYAQKELGDK